MEKPLIFTFNFAKYCKQIYFQLQLQIIDTFLQIISSIWITVWSQQMLVSVQNFLNDQMCASIWQYTTKTFIVKLLRNKLSKEKQFCFMWIFSSFNLGKIFWNPLLDTKNVLKTKHVPSIRATNLTSSGSSFQHTRLQYQLLTASYRWVTKTKIVPKYLILIYLSLSGCRSIPRLTLGVAAC